MVISPLEVRYALARTGTVAGQGSGQLLTAVRIYDDPLGSTCCCGGIAAASSTKDDYPRSAEKLKFDALFLIDATKHRLYSSTRLTRCILTAVIFGCAADKIGSHWARVVAPNPHKMPSAFQSPIPQTSGFRALPRTRTNSANASTSTQACLPSIQASNQQLTS